MKHNKGAHGPEVEMRKATWTMEKIAALRIPKGYSAANWLGSYASFGHDSRAVIDDIAEETGLSREEISELAQTQIASCLS